VVHRPAAALVEDEKLKIVLESLQAPRQVTATARRHGVSRSLLLRW
jgi:transposase